MKAKIVNGQCVAVMSHREAVFLAAIMANASLYSGNVEDEIDSIGNCLWPIYDYPQEGFMSDFGFSQSASVVLDEHMEQLNIADHHYA